MRTLSFITVLAVTIVTPSAARAQAVTDEVAIRAIVAEQVVAWDASDGARYARHVAPSVSFTNLFGMADDGADAFTARHSEILSTFYKGTSKKHRCAGSGS